VKGMPPSTSALSLSAEDLWPRLHHYEGSQSFFLVRWIMFSGIPPRSPSSCMRVGTNSSTEVWTVHESPPGESENETTL